MNVKLGWSGDIHGTWTKMDVEVDETDFNLHFVDAGADPENLTITPLEKFKLMFTLAEIFVSLHKASKFPEYFGKDEDQEALRKLIAARNDLTKAVISRNDKAPF